MMFTFFVWQAFIPLADGGALHRELELLLERSREEMGFAEKNAFYMDIARRIGAYAQSFERGVWDYVEDPSLAKTEYDGWTKGTEVDAHEADYAVDPYRTPQRHMFVTILVYVQKGSSSDEYISNACDIKGDAMWTKKTMETLLGLFAKLNFMHVRSDAIYLRPGTEDEGVTQEELAEPHYAYVKTLS